MFSDPLVCELLNRFRNFTIAQFFLKSNCFCQVCIIITKNKRKIVQNTHDKKLRFLKTKDNDKEYMENFEILFFHLLLFFNAKAIL